MPNVNLILFFFFSINFFSCSGVGTVSVDIPSQVLIHHEIERMLMLILIVAINEIEPTHFFLPN